MRLALVRYKYSAFGGAERFVERLLPHLVSEQNLEATLLATQWNGAALPSWMHWQHVPVLPLGSLVRGLSFERNVCRTVARGGFDLVQSHERVPCADLYRAGDGVHREWLRQRHRVLSPAAWVRVRLNPFHRYLLDVERRLFTSPKLRAVIANSEMVKREIMANFNLPPECIHTIYSGVDLERFHPDLRALRMPVRERFGIPSDVPLFIYVGSGFQRKGLAQALRALPGRAWLMVVGKDKHERQIRLMASRLGIAPRVRFLGPQRNVAHLYGAADALVLPTLYDPFPNVCFEAMAAGLPVVTTTKSGAAELLEPGRTGFVCEALDVAALRGHLADLCDTQMAQAMGATAREMVERYPVAAAAERMLTLYRALSGSFRK
jgi:UDP-glucose:(heptosyl)LPS alpha-1,3-glucosyltransferase